MNTVSRSFQCILAIVALNVICFEFQSDYLFNNVFSINNSSILSSTSSMFTHATAQHLFYNMAVLVSLSYPVFQQTTSRVWRSLWVALLIYFVSGLGSFYGLTFISHLYERQWKARVVEGQAAVACNHFLCDAVGLNKLNKVLGKAYAHVVYGDERISLWYFNWIPRVGASGAIYGILGARIYTAVWSDWHHAPGSMFYASVALMIAQDIKDAPALSLKGLRFHLLNGDNVDHVAHLCGLMTGLCIAHFIHRLPQFQPLPRRYGWFDLFPGRISWLRRA